MIAIISIYLHFDGVSWELVRKNLITFDEEVLPLALIFALSEFASPEVISWGIPIRLH